MVSIHECYVPCSSKLSKHLNNPEHREVLLSTNLGIGKRTQYSLFAIKDNMGWIPVNLTLMNKVVEEAICEKQWFPSLNLQTTVEQRIEGYKADVGFFNEVTQEKGIIEIKGIISTDREALHPKVESPRAVEQLVRIKELLRKDFKVYYILLALSPTITRILIDSEHSGFYARLLECLELGMRLRGYLVQFEDGQLSLGEEVPVDLGLLGQKS